MSYISTLNNNKEQFKSQLDRLINVYKGQPVGFGYIDIIIARDYYIDFINDLTKFNFAIEAVSWWCHCTPDNEKISGCPHGMGGPRSEYFAGWFSERCQDFDRIESKYIKELENDNYVEIIKKMNDKALKIIKNKQTNGNLDGTYHLFEKDKCLTPALWLYIPKDWKNNLH